MNTGLGGVLFCAPSHLASSNGSRRRMPYASNLVRSCARPYTRAAPRWQTVCRTEKSFPIPRSLICNLQFPVFNKALHTSTCPCPGSGPVARQAAPCLPGNDGPWRTRGNRRPPCRRGAQDDCRRRTQARTGGGIGWVRQRPRDAPGVPSRAGQAAQRI